MEKALLLSAAYGWFAGLLIIMVVVTALFALILFIALKPIKKDEFDETSSAKKALVRRETELTIELLNSKNDAKTRAELENKLREVKSAERLVGELMPEEETPPRPVKKGQPAQKPAQKAQKPAEKPVRKPADKPAQKADKPAEKPAKKPAITPADKSEAQKPAKKPAEKAPEVPSEGEKNENRIK